MATQAQLNRQKKQTAYAWAQYFQSRTEQLEEAHQQVSRVEIMTQVESVPAHIKTELLEMAKELQKKWTCPVCTDFIATKDLEVTNCGHFFCDACLAGVKQHSIQEGQASWNCPLCRRSTKHNHN